VIDPLAGPVLNGHIDAVQDAFRKSLQGIYFRQNFRYAGIGVVATFAWGLYTAATLDAQSSMFLTFWLLMFTSIAGMVIGGIWTSKPTRPSMKQKVMRVLVPVLFFGIPGAIIYVAALPQSHGFVLALLLSVILNSTFFVIMRAPTQRGIVMLQQLAGFREFLLRVEQDPLDRVNTPEQRAEFMNRFLPYAIALNVREGWGDKMASAFSDAIVER
jgi:FtsH-binding integral membrane protein